MLIILIVLLALTDAYTISNLQVEYLTSPIGVDITQPRFSYQLNGESLQTSYQIIVEKQNDNQVVWDTKQVTSSKTNLIQYQGKPLVSDTSYTVTITSTSSKGVSKTGDNNHISSTFRTGLLQGKKDLNPKTQWITGGNTNKLLRTSFTVPAKITEAFVYVSGIGYHELYCNGKKVGDHRLDVGWSDYSQRVFYATHDITSCLQTNPTKEHVLAVMLGNGWFAEAGNQPGAYKEPPQLLLQSNIYTNDGNVTTISTNPSSWKVNKGPITYDSLYNGETYDARLEQFIQGWNGPGFDDSSWMNATVANPGVGILSSQLFEPIRAISEIKPLNITEPKPGMFVIDFGQNIAGFLRLSIRDTIKGQIVTMKHAESIMHPPYGPVDGTLYYGNLRTAKATDTYICKGNTGNADNAGSAGSETYSPTFTQHGFRYAEITGLKKGTTLAMQDVVAVVMHSDLKQTGSFHTSNTLLNQIQHNTVWGQKTNFMSVPTDCPQRDERKGWMGDAALTIEEATYNFGTGAFYTSFLNQIQDDQGSDGHVTNFVPSIGQTGPGAPNWQSAYPTIVWTMYRYLGDLQIVQKHWNSLKAYLTYWKKEYVKNGVATFDSGFGDWVPAGPQKANGSLVGLFAYLHDLTLLEELATAMNDTVTHAAIHLQRKTIGPAFHTYWYDEIHECYGSGLQTENAMALWLGLQSNGGVVPDVLTLNKVLNYTIKDIETNGMHTTSGIIGIKMLFESLSKYDRGDVPLLMSLVTSYPSYGYMIHNEYEPATTLWELWDAPSQGNRTYATMDSRNHIMFGSISSYFYRYLCGIDAPLGSFGYDVIRFAPRGVGTPGATDVTSVDCHVLTPHGNASVSWTAPAVPSVDVDVEVMLDTKVTLDITIPHGSKATIRVPLVVGVGHTIDTVVIRQGSVVVWENGAFILGGGVVSGVADGNAVEFVAKVGIQKQFFTVDLK